MPTTVLHNLFYLYSFLLLTFSQPASTAEQQTLTGLFTIIWGDNFSANIPPSELYFLTSEAGTTSELLIDSSVARVAGGLLSLNGKVVSVSVPINPLQHKIATSAPLVVNRIYTEQDLYEVDDFAMSPQAVTGSQPWVTVMCKFQDIADEPQNLSYFQNMYSSSYPGLDHYWQEASYNIVNISGISATGWYTLPQPRSYYVYDNKLDFSRITNDCTAAADAAIYFPDYIGINLMFNSDLGGFAWGGSRFIAIDGQSKSYRVTWEPPWGYKDITVIAHEMGHGFGMPHSSGNYGLTYDSVWDVMSNAWANCQAANHATYGCLGQQTIGYHRDRVGWINTEKKYTFPGTQETITLERLTLPTTTDYVLAQIPIAASSNHFYTVEVRKKTGYDTKLASEAVIIHEVDLSRSRPAYIIDIDGNGITGDDGAIWQVGETFTDATNNVCIKITGKTGTGYTLKIGCISPPPPPPHSSPTMVPMNYLLLH